MKTLLRLSIKFGDILALRIGIFSYEYTKHIRDECLKDYNLNFIIHVPYLEAGPCIQIIEKLTSNVYIIAHGEDLYYDSGSNLKNKELLISSIATIMSYVTLLTETKIDTYYYTTFQSSDVTDKPNEIMKHQIMIYHENSNHCIII